MSKEKTTGSGDPGVDGSDEGHSCTHITQAVCISFPAGEWRQPGPPERSFYTGHEVRAALQAGTKNLIQLGEGKSLLH